jgi:hypothetical protein
MKLVAITYDNKTIRFHENLTVLFSESIKIENEIIAKIQECINPVVYEKKNWLHMLTCKPKIIDNINSTLVIKHIEFDMHPKYQRKIIEVFRTRFPNIQLIITTCSPFILQSVVDGDIINMDNPEQLMYNCNQMSIEDISETIMGVYMPQRSKRYEDMFNTAQEYYIMLESEPKVTIKEKELLTDKLNKLTIPFSNNQAFMAFLEMERVYKLRL